MASIARSTAGEGSVEPQVYGGPVPEDADLAVQAATATDVATAAGLGLGDNVSRGEEERRRLRWGPQYLPEIDGREERRQFSQICEQVLDELEGLEAADYLMDGKVSDEGAGVVAEIANLLEQLFDCPFGDGESLKSVVVAIQSQTNNVDWTPEILAFLRDTMQFLRARYVVNDQTVDEVYEILKEHGLDPFRGSVSDRDMKTRYRLVEVEEP